jgi:hypothetical protein
MATAGPLEVADRVRPMSETIITVAGYADTHHSPERAVVQLALGFEGPERQSVFEQTRQLHAETSDSLRALHDPVADAVTRLGMIGFDIACETARSGSRIQGYLVNDL